MAKFKVGDRVVINKNFWSSRQSAIAIIKAVTRHDSYAVETIDHTGGHECDGLCKRGHGWWVYNQHLDLALEMTPFDMKVREYIDRALSP